MRIRWMISMGCRGVGVRGIGGSRMRRDKRMI
jgi:hypothetical protein